jgi:hypothetical protein
MDPKLFQKLETEVLRHFQRNNTHELNPTLRALLDLLATAAFPKGNDHEQDGA